MIVEILQLLLRPLIFHYLEDGCPKIIPGGMVEL